MKVICLLFSIIIFLSVCSISNTFADDFVFDLYKYEKAKNRNIESLKMQLANGVQYNEIICRNLLYLVYKSSNGSPVCVDEYHVGKLVTRGWAVLGDTSLIIAIEKKSIIQVKKLQLL